MTARERFTRGMGEQPVGSVARMGIAAWGQMCRRWLLPAMVAMAACAGPAMGQEAKLPAPVSFETEADNPFKTNELSMSRVEKNATDGRFSLRVEIRGAEREFWPGLWIYPTVDRNWNGRQALVLDVFVETAETFSLGAQLQVEGRKENGQASLGDLHPGWNRGVALNLPDFGWPDLSRVTSLALYVSKPRKDIVYYMDNVRWEAARPGPNPDATGWFNVKDFGASGSDFETTAATTEGSSRITVADVGDFKVGQGVTVSRCNIRYTQRILYGPGEPYSTSKVIKDEVEIRGYDGAAGSWLTYLLEVDGADPVTFRWKDDLSQPWKGTQVPVTFDWQKLSAAIEVRFKKQEWKPGQLITFGARDQLASTILRIEGKVLTLKHSANRTATGAVVRHTDRDAAQVAINEALRQRCNLAFPAGRYRIPGGLRIANAAALCVQGSDGSNTILDISDGEGSCFALQGGTEVTIRNFRMVGHTGLAEAPRSFTTSSGYGFWPNSLKGCSAVTMSGTERVLIENVHASRMASECFYAQGPARQGAKEPAQYQKELTYLRCTVTDCAANAFNNNDRGENTSILYCRVDGAGWHAAEMPARFLRVVGSTFRNTGAITVGDMSHRFEDLHELGCGQAFIENNVFEGIGRCGGVAVNHGSGQVVISSNLFINFNGPAVTVSSASVRPTLPWFRPDAPQEWGSYPSRNVVITGNVIDMTYTGEGAVPRTGISVSGSQVTVSDNQIYVRGECDRRVTGISLWEPALDLNVHDNLVRNCGVGLATGRVASRVTQVIDGTTFMEASLPLEWRDTHLYRGWNLVWLSGGKPAGTSVIESYDPGTLRFTLKAPREMKVGDAFEVYPPGGANWSIHGNTVTGCADPVVLDSYGSPTSTLKGNTITRDAAVGVKEAVAVKGRFQLLGNHLAGFDETGCAALSLYPDRFGQAPRSLYRDNVLERCATPIAEGSKGLWDAAERSGNTFVGCGGAPN